MKIKRIRVEEGFLNGLDLSFSDGLNVIIGPRGSGKTSIVELIRYCLGVEAYTAKMDEKARNFALSILGSGQVALTIEAGGVDFNLSRTAEGRDVPPGFDYKQPLVLSQGEIESIGLHEEGKLRLIDSFTPGPSKVKAAEIAALSEISSISSQIRSLNDELQKIDDEIVALKGIEEELEKAKEEQEQFLGAIETMKPQREDLSRLAELSAKLSVQQEVFSRTQDSLLQWAVEVERLATHAPSIEEWPSSAGDKDLLLSIRKSHADTITALRRAVNSIRDNAGQAKERMDEATTEKIKAESKARDLRAQVEKIQEGAGAIERRVAELKEKAGQLDALRSLRGEKLRAINRLRESRGKSLDQLDSLRQSRFEERSLIERELNKVLKPHIELKMLRAAQLSDYESALIETLRGSGIRYSTLAPRLAQSMSPRELAEAIENSDVETISTLADITEERASRAIGYTQSVGLDRILTCNLEDGVRLSLLVGSEYKATEQLSTGQRCTVILPILLSEHGSLLIVDQPEDNLDNAYIVDTVIRSMREAADSNQIICTTHNPNIPVLGEADLVVLLDYDGRRGFVRSAKHLDHPSTIEAITTVMEGGKEAFMKRAEFYTSRDNPNG